VDGRVWAVSCFFQKNYEQSRSILEMFILRCGHDPLTFRGDRRDRWRSLSGPSRIFKRQGIENDALVFRLPASPCESRGNHLVVQHQRFPVEGDRQYVLATAVLV